MLGWIEVELGFWELFFTPKFAWTKKFVGLKCFALKIILDSKNLLNPKFFLSQIFLNQIFLNQNFFEPAFFGFNIFLEIKLFWNFNLFGPKRFLIQNLFGLKHILDSQQRLESGKFQLTRWSHEVVSFSVRTNSTSQSCLKGFNLSICLSYLQLTYPTQNNLT